jgi:putative addiction module antidote
MMKVVTLRQVGRSVGATLPKDMAYRLRLEPGDSVFAIETDRGVLLTPYDPGTERALEVASRSAKRCRNVLRQLARKTVARCRP